MSTKQNIKLNIKIEKYEKMGTYHKCKKVKGTFITKYPFHKLKIGNSFFIKLPRNVKTKQNLAQNIHSNLRSYVSLNLVHYKIKTGYTKTGVRVWRLQ